MDSLNQPTIQLLGIEFNNTGLAETIAGILARPCNARFAYIVTPNADHVERLRRIPPLAVVYAFAARCLLDSQLIGNCADALGLARPAVVTGADLTEALLAESDRLRIAVIGMNEMNFAALASRYPQIVFVHHQPPMGLLHDMPAFYRARDFARDTQAAFTFITLGSPVQELLAYAIALRRDAVGTGLCIGGGLEFCAGTARRAPLWMRRHGMEWLHRLIHNPFRLAGRYLVDDPKILLFLAISALRQKMR